MAAETPRAPEDVSLPESDSASIRPDESAPDVPERPRSSPTNNTGNTSCWVTLTWLQFIDVSSFAYVLSMKSEPWKKASNLAVRKLPFGGAITIPLPSSTDDLEATFQRFDEANNSPLNPQLRMLSRTPVGNCPDPEACDIWAQYAWDRWVHHKPNVIVFDTTGFNNKGTNWITDDVTEYWGEGTVKLWISKHFSNDLISPTQISAEFHIIVNNMVILEPTIPSGFGDKMRVLRQIASLMIQQHMGSFSRRGLAIWFPLPQLRVFFHRINMFRPAPPSRLFQRVTATHLRAEGRFPGNDSLPKLGMRRSPWFVESCVSIVAVFKDAKDESTLRSVLIIQDKESNTLGNEELTMEACEDINSRRRAEFLSALLHQYYLLWERAWNGCLDKIDDSVKITLEDISDDTRLDTFMFDGANFERSRSYFAVLQLLRIFSDRIKETRKDLMQVIDQLGQNRSLFKSTGLEEAESRLVERIDRKTEEIKTLRDGLFNSTSVREATRATQMNRYVIVFTVVTVLYTPPSFISALFATPLPYFTKGDPDDFKRAVGIATGTTVLAAIILLVIAYSFDNVVRNPKDRLVSMVKSTRRRGRSIVAKSQSFTRVPFQTVQEAGRALREFAGKAVERVGRVEQRGTQNSAPQQSRGKTDQRQDIDLSDRTANAATPRNDHGGNIV